MKRQSIYAVACDSTVERLRELEFARGVNEARRRWLPLMEEIETFLEEHEDIRDGEDGRPLPNTAMSLLMELREQFRLDKPDSIHVPDSWFKNLDNGRNSGGNPTAINSGVSDQPSEKPEASGCAGYRSDGCGNAAEGPHSGGVAHQNEAPEPEPFSARLQQQVIPLMEVIRQAREECGGALSLDWHANADRALSFVRRT